MRLAHLETNEVANRIAKEMGKVMFDKANELKAAGLLLEESYDDACIRALIGCLAVTVGGPGNREEHSRLCELLYPICGYSKPEEGR